MSEFKYPPQGTQAGTVIGPGSSTDNAVARFNGTTGESIQNSGVIIDDSDNVTGVESVTVDGLTASRVVVTNGSKTLASSAVTATELGYVGGVTSAIQTQLDAKIPLTQKGAANGVATLDASTKIPQSQLPAIAITDTFVVNSQAAMLALTAETGDVAVRTDLNKTFILAGSDPTILANWQELLTPTDVVLSVNGQTGAVSLSTTNISEGSNLYFTDERAQDAVGTILADTNDIDLSYSDGTPSISADLRASSITSKTEVVADVADFVMLSDTSDSGNLKKADLGDFLLKDATQTATNKTFTTPALTTPTVNDSAIFSQETTPSNPSSGFNKIYPKADGKWYSLDSAGVETPIGSGSGAGEKTYITNPSGIPDAAAAAPTGWGSVGDLDIVVTKTDGDLPREYTTDSGIKITADSNTQSTADYVYFDFTLDDVDLSKKLKIQWSQKTTGTYNAGDLAVIITSQADRTTALHTPVTTAIPASTGDFVTTFDSSTTATLSLVIRATTDMTTDGGIVISDVVVGPGEVVQGFAGSEWQDYTPSNTQGFGTITSNSLQWRRVGSSIEVRGRFSSGTVAASEAQLGLPPGLTCAGSASDRYTVGTWIYNKATGTTRKGGILTSRGGQAYVEWTSDDYTTASSPFTTLTGANIVDSSTAVAVQFSVPIAEWAGNGTVNLGPGAQVEYAYNTSTADSSDTTSFGYGPSGVTFGSFSTSTRKKRVRFQYPIQSDDILVLEVKENSTAPWFPAESTIGQSSSTTTGIVIEHVNSTDVDVAFGSAGYGNTVRAAAGAWSGLAGAWFWRVRKAKASAPVGYGMAGPDGSAGLYKAGQAPGLATGAAIPAGYVGERLVGTWLSPTVNTATQTNFMSLTLTAGVWLVYGKAQLGTAGTTQTRFETSLSTTSATLDTKSQVQDNFSGITGDRLLAPNPIYINTTGTTVYLVVRSTHTGTNPVPSSGFNELYAVRIA